MCMMLCRPSLLHATALTFHHFLVHQMSLISYFIPKILIVIFLGLKVTFIPNFSALLPTV